MSVKIRLRRIGKKDRAQYRIVVADESSKRDGKVIDTIGTYDPKNPSSTHINKDMLAAWIGKGARPTDAVRKLL